MPVVGYTYTPIHAIFRDMDLPNSLSFFVAFYRLRKR